MLSRRLKAGVGQLDLVAFAAESQAPRAFAELEEVINRRMGPTGLMLFLEFDHGAVLRKETGLDVPKIVRLVIGNPLVMKEMAKHVPDAGSYAPVTVLVDERRDGVHRLQAHAASLPSCRWIGRAAHAEQQRSTAMASAVLPLACSTV